MLCFIVFGESLSNEALCFKSTSDIAIHPLIFNFTFITSGCRQAPASKAECKMALSRLTMAGERSLSATVFWGAPKMCPLLERSSLAKERKGAQ